MKRLPYPFPGMNPYLEHPILWEPTHARLVIAMANQIQPQLDPRYIASIEERVYVEAPRRRKPDVWVERTADEGAIATVPQLEADTALIVQIDGLEIKQRRIEVLDSYDDMKVVTAIELVSPSNKVPGEARESYEAKQDELLSRDCHFVEIDLIRRGTHVMNIPEWRVAQLDSFDYLCCVSRWPRRNRYELYSCRLCDRLPRIRVPLIAPDPDVILDLQAALEQIYHEARFGVRLRYDKPCVPRLPDADQEWAYDQLEKAGIREKAKKPRPANGKGKKR
jgi:hypothetical protein